MTAALSQDSAHEYVIFTAIIHLEPDAGRDHSSFFTSAAKRKLSSIGKDLVVILSSCRVVVTEYHRRVQGAYLKKQWESTLATLTVPIFERSGGGAKLLLRSSDPDSVTYGR